MTLGVSNLSETDSLWVQIHCESWSRSDNRIAPLCQSYPCCSYSCHAYICQCYPKCQSIFKENVHSDLISSKILKTCHMMPSTFYILHAGVAPNFTFGVTLNTFPRRDFSLILPRLLVNFLTFSRQLSNFLTFRSFPDKRPPSNESVRYVSQHSLVIPGGTGSSPAQWCQGDVM